ncbi:SDR family oxidoreductase [Hwanghaeella sp.]|uniref:SDR family oxidoreductase n=1 Tax=Hwanghaeella sp. TaxID=2605943 RepID=UPI003CCBB38E
MPTLLLTGASRGIGRELLNQYKQDGWSVIAACRDPGAVGDIGADQVLPLEVTSEVSIKALKKTLGDTPVDVLWNNAGVYLDKGMNLSETAADLWSESFAVNTIAPLRIAHAFAANVAGSGKKTMAFTSSRMGSIGDLGGASSAYAYRSSKTALNMAAAILANDLRDRGVKTVVLHPGWVRTDMGGPSADIDTATSAGGMKKVVDNLTDAQSGGFFNYDGKTWPW